MARKKKRVYSTQRAPDIVALAKKGKSSGLLSKQVNLHRGKYVSRGTLKKVRELRGAIEKGYKAEPVSKKRARELEGLGLQVVQGFKVVRPPGIVWKNRVVKGKEPAGVTRIHRGYVQRLTLPWDVYSLRQFIEKARDNPQVFNSMKKPDELFAFKLFGHASYRPFISIEDLIDYVLTRYVAILDRPDIITPLEDTVTGFEIIRVDQDHIRDVIPSRDEREKMRRERRKNYAGTRKPREYSTSYQAYKVRVRDKNAIKAAQRRSKMSKSEKEEYKAKARIRAAKSYANRKRP